METGALLLPDNTVLDTSQPPPGFEFPKPDFSEVVFDEPNEVPAQEKIEGPLSKPTFKNALQAKKRLQAFSSARSTSLPSSPSTKKFKTHSSSAEEKIDDTKKSSKKANPDDKAKAVIEEIEEIKREEQAYWEAKRQSSKRSRSRTRSKSPNKGRFKKVDKKARNYRKRSVTPEKSKKVHKKIKKYPKNWKEFNDFELSFNLNRDFEVQAPIGNNELLKQILFESPALPMITFKMKTVNREDKVVPFQYLRYTRTKPVICHSVNSVAIKEPFLSRKLIFDTLPKQIIANIENLYSNSLKFKMNTNKKNTRNWFPREWKDGDEQCKLLEKSIGLSFLQTYTGEEDESEFVARDPEVKIEEKCSEIIKDETQTVNDKDQIKKDEAKKKKKKEKTAVSVEKKKKSKEKKKPIENANEIRDKRKKRKKDKTKRKEKKKTKHKKIPKEKKKKDKKHQIGVKISPKDKLQKPNKESVMEELKLIEEKLTKRKESEKNKEDVKKDKVEKEEIKAKPEKEEIKAKVEKEEIKAKVEKEEIKAKVEKEQIKDKIEKQEIKDKVSTRKRKHSEHDEKSKKAKFEKHRKGNSHKSEDSNKVSKKDKKHEEEILPKKNAIEKPVETKKPKLTQEIAENLTNKNQCENEKKRKSRWSDVHLDCQIDIVADLPINNEEITAKEHVQDKETTPDTDEYHSHWESDDDVSSSIPRQPIKMGNRNWESDEELFDRTRNVNKPLSPIYSNLEIPLNIVNFSRRTEWTEKPISYVNEIKLLEEERRSLSEERKKLEVERQRILKLQEEAKLEIEDKRIIPKEEKEEKHRFGSSTPEIEQKNVKKENIDIIDFNIDSLNNSLLSNVSSVESNFPIAALENEYEEFIKAVSSDNSVQPKKKLSRSSSSSTSSSDSDHKKKKRKKRKKKKRKMREAKSGNIFDEFDIPVPSELPDIVPTPVPVPSPIENIVPINPTNLILQSIIIDVKNEEPKLDAEPQLTKPFIFPSIVLPPKKNNLVDNSNFKLNDDSDSIDFTDKFVKKTEQETVLTHVLTHQELVVEEKIENVIKLEDQGNKNIPDIPDIQKETLKNEEESKKNENKPKQVAEEPIKIQTEVKKNTDVKTSVSRSSSPQHRTEKTKEKKRSRSRSRSRKRSPIRRKESPLPLHRRYSSPRRRSPPRRRGSPRRSSPSLRRRISPPRRRRRSSSLSPPRSRTALRKRTPSPRIRRASPLNSPLDGFKRSVADSTISDDMLPQPTPEEYSESPPLYRKAFRTHSMSPVQSPRRISLDDRINQVLGLEKNELTKQPPPASYPSNYQYPQSYGHQQYGQYQQYNQFSGQKSEYIPPFVPPPVFTQPPPPIVKSVSTPTPSKVVQVGNILQVVPNEEITPTMIENETSETSQKIVQVGNMLQIVPGIIIPSKPPIAEVAPTQPPQPPPPPEKTEIQSAESIMKQKKAEREKRRQERERRRKEKDKKRKEREKRKQMKLKIKTENMIKRAIQIEAEALASEDLEDEVENPDLPVQWPPVPVVVASSTPSCKGILLIEGSSRKRKSVQFADGVKPGEGTSPSGGEELSSPPPAATKLPKEKRYKKIKIPKKNKKKKIKVKVVKKVQTVEDDDDDDSLPPPSPPPGSPPPHLFPSRAKTHTINNVHQYIGNIIQAGAPTYPYRPPMPVIINRHQPPPGYMPGNYHGDVGVPHQSYQGVPSHH